MVEESYLGGEITSSTTHTYSYDDANWLDLLTAYDGVSLTYDAIGNPLSYYNGTSYTMTWAKRRQLASVSMGDETTGTTAISYAYDMDGIRRSKTVGGGPRSSSRKVALWRSRAGAATQSTSSTMLSSDPTP